MRGLSLFLIGVAIGLALTSCAGVDPIIVSGQSLKVAKAEYHATVQLMDQALALGLVTDEQFHKWRLFSDYFEVAFERAVELWDLASKAADDNTRLGAGAIVDGLHKQLLRFQTPQLGSSP